MINVSSEFKATMETRTDFKCAATITFIDGSALELTEDDFLVSNNGLVDGAGASTFPLGIAICRTIQIELMNDDERYAGYAFLDAEIALRLLYKLDSGGTEDIAVGTFTVNSATTYGDTVIINAQDDMCKADKPYSTRLSYPTSLYRVFKECCDDCGILTSQGSFRNSDFVVASAPSTELTYRSVLGYVAMIAGGNARISRSRRLEILTYDFETLTNARNDYEALYAKDTTGEGNITLLPETAVCADNNGAVTIPQGGAFTDSGGGRIVGARLDAGIHDLKDWYPGLKVETDDIIITGLETTVTTTDPDTGETTEDTITRGEEGYTLAVSNPLITGKEEHALELIGNVVLGAQFRKFSGDYRAYPLAEFMDLCRITDRKGRIYYSVITDVNFVWYGITTMSNSAEPPLRNGAQYVDMETRASIIAAKEVAREKTERERAIKALSDTLAAAGGLYSTQDVLSDGSVIYYLHDKPALADSRNVIKLTSDALGLSTDGGKTYPCGVYVNGDVIANILRADGISADWITTGALTVKNAAGAVLLNIDKDNGTVYIAADCISLNGQSLEFTVNQKADAADTIGSVDVLYGLSSSATDPSDITNWNTVAPAWVDGKYMWQKTVTYYADHKASDPHYTESAPTCLTGATGAAGRNGKDGKNGDAGLSAYQVAVTNGYTGTEAQWLASLNGENGADGADGRSIEKIVCYYLATSLAQTGLVCTDTQDGRIVLSSVSLACTDSGTGKIIMPTTEGVSATDSGVGAVTLASDNLSVDTPGWNEDVSTQQIDADHKYLWMYEEIFYSDGTSAKTAPVCIATYVVDGAPGKSAFEVAVENGYTGTESEWLQSLVGKDGSQGIPGTAGDNGQTSYLHIAYATNATGTEGFSISDSAAKTYIGQYTDFSLEDSTDPTKYKWTLIKGTGWQAVQELYYLSTSSTTAPTAPTQKITSTSTAANVWTTKCPTWRSGYYYWTCSQMLQTDGNYAWSTVLLASGLNSANSTANTANTTANEAVAVTRQIELTKFVFDADGMHVFNNGAEQITVGSDGKLTAKNVDLSGTVQTLDLNYGRASLFSSGKIQFYGCDVVNDGDATTLLDLRASIQMDLLYGMGAVDGSQDGLVCLISEANENTGTIQVPFFALGSYDRETLAGQNYAYILNNGLDPNGYTERSIFYGNVRMVNDLYLGSSGVVYARETSDNRGNIQIRNPATENTILNMYGIGDYAEIDINDKNGTRMLSLYGNSTNGGMLQLRDTSGSAATLTYAKLVKLLALV